MFSKEGLIKINIGQEYKNYGNYVIREETSTRNLTRDIIVSAVKASKLKRN